LVVRATSARRHPDAGVQPLGQLLVQLPGGVERRSHLEEAMNHAPVAANFHFNTSVSEVLRVRFALVAEGITFGGHDERRRQSSDIMVE
jgi:hypothetical protein